MPTTAGGLRYPSLSDDPNVPEDIQNLATDADARAIPRFASAAARNTAYPAPSEGQHAYLNDLNCVTWYDGTAWRGAWTNYTVTWTTSGTAPSLGDGTLSGRYVWTASHTVIAEVLFQIGGTTNGGTGVWFFSLPVTSAFNTIGGGTAYVLDTGVQDYGFVTKIETTTTFRMVWHTGSFPTGGISLGAGDQIRMQVIYTPA